MIWTPLFQAIIDVKKQTNNNPALYSLCVGQVLTYRLPWTQSDPKYSETRDCYKLYKHVYLMFLTILHIIHHSIMYHCIECSVFWLYIIITIGLLPSTKTGLF